MHNAPRIRILWTVFQASIQLTGIGASCFMLESGAGQNKQRAHMVHFMICDSNRIRKPDFKLLPKQQTYQMSPFCTYPCNLAQVVSDSR